MKQQSIFADFYTSSYSKNSQHPNTIQKLFKKKTKKLLDAQHLNFGLDVLLPGWAVYLLILYCLIIFLHSWWHANYISPQ